MCSAVFPFAPLRRGGRQIQLGFLSLHQASRNKVVIPDDGSYAVFLIATGNNVAQAANGFSGFGINARGARDGLFLIADTPLHTPRGKVPYDQIPKSGRQI